MSQESITLMDGVVLQKQNSTDEQDTPSITDERSLNELTGIDRELMTKLDKFLRSHVLKLDMSESRGKKGRLEKLLYQWFRDIPNRLVSIINRRLFHYGYASIVNWILFSYF